MADDKESYAINLVDDYPAIIHAIYHKRDDEVKDMIAYPLSPAELDEIKTEDSAGGHTSLHMAAQVGSVTIAKMLLDANASVDVTSKEGFTPLQNACQCGHNLVAKLLLDAGANKFNSPLIEWVRLLRLF